MSHNELQADCKAPLRKSFVAYFPMSEAVEAGQALKVARLQLGWSAARLAKEVSHVADMHNDRMQLTQQAVSQFENGQLKSVPRWARYADLALQLQRFPPDERRQKLWELTYGLGNDLDSPATDEEAADQLDAVLIPQVEIGLSMGGGSVLEDWPVLQMVPLSRTWLRSLTPSSAEHLMVARGDGDSMMPTILDGDLVIIDRSQDTPRQQDRIWALACGGWGMVKRLRALPDGSLQINSDNPAVSPINAVEGEAQVIGRVVGVVRRI